MVNVIKRTQQKGEKFPSKINGREVDLNQLGVDAQKALHFLI